MLDLDELSLKDKSIEDIINSEKWQRIWADNKLPTCARQCGKWDTNIISQSKDQFISLDKFK
jgi:hypothetical protein